MPFSRILIAVKIVAVLGSELPAQIYACRSATSDEAVGLRLDVVNWVTGTDPRVVAKRNSLQVLAATVSQVSVVTQTNKCQQAALAYHAYNRQAATPAISRSVIVIKIGNNRYVIQDPAELQGEFGTVVITDGSFNVLAKISA